MEQLKCVDNKKWIWIIIAVLLLSGNIGSEGGCNTGLGGSGNFLGDLSSGNNSWIWILALVFLFSGGF